MFACIPAVLVCKVLSLFTMIFQLHIPWFSLKAGVLFQRLKFQYKIFLVVVKLRCGN